MDGSSLTNVHRQRLALLWVPLAALLALLLLWASPLHRPLSLALADWPPPRHEAPADGAVVVDIDSAALREVRPLLGPWPLGRDAYAMVAGWLQEAGATAVVFNLVLADPREGDAALARTFGGPAPVVLAATGHAQRDSAPTDTEQLHGVPAVALALAAPAWEWADLTLPADALLQAPGLRAGSVGVVSTPLDEDGRLRRMPLLHRHGQMVLPSLALAPLLAAAPAGSLRHDPRGPWFQYGRHSWPVDGAGMFVFTPPAAEPPALPFAAVVQAAMGQGDGRALAERVKGKAVFIGSSAAADEGVLTSAGQMDGTQVLAAAYEALRADAVVRPPLPAAWAAMLALAWLPAWLPVLRGRTWLAREGLASVAVLCLLLGFAMLSAWALQTQVRLLEPLVLLAAGLASAALAHALALQRRQRELDVEQRLTQAASRAKSEFLANVSHEIRTPMNAVLGMAELLAETELSAVQRRHVEVFRRSGEALSALIDDLLDLSKIEAGKLQPQRAPFALRSLLAERVALLAPGAERKGLRVELRVADPVPAAVAGDALRLGQVLVNLVGNAIKFTRYGGVTISVAPEGDGWLRFTVRDTGSGIAPEQIQRIFQPFVQADGSVTREFGGTGLGLTIAHHLVGLMGGRLDAESAPGQGSTFTFALPLPAAELPTPDAPVAPGVAPRPGLTLLLAEDNATNVYLVQGMLKDAGHRLDVVTDGHQAVARFAAGRYDAVLMDVQMPGLDGLSATRALRRIEQQQGRVRTPVVALTAGAFDTDVQASLAAGCDAHLSKPVRKAQLLATLGRLTTQALAPVHDAPPPPLPQALAALQADAALDVAEAVARLGDARLYLATLPAAAATLRGWEPQFRSAWSGAQTDDAVRLAHDLKGLAATLGARPLAATAARLEAALRGGDGDVGELLKEAAAQAAPLAAALARAAGR